MTESSTMLADLFADGLVFVPSAGVPGSPWLPDARPALDALTGGQLAVAGGFPVVCHADVSSAGVLRLLEEAGHPPARRLLRYRSEAEYLGTLERLVADGAGLALTHAQALPAGARTVPPVDLLRQLNDKAELAALAPAAALPRRRVVLAAELERLEPEFPVVAKAASKDSSGAGYGVRLCRDAADWEAARRDLAPAPRVVLEEWLDVERNWCVQCVVVPSGAVTYLGGAEQVSAPDGAYRGNWIEVDDDPVPPAAVEIATSMAAAGAARGYRGPAGFDIVRCRDGALRVIDANFRFNGSTVPLLLRPRLRRDGVRLARMATLVHDGPFAELAPVVRAAMARGHFLPYAALAPPVGPARVSGLVLGTTRAEVRARRNALVREAQP